VTLDWNSFWFAPGDDHHLGVVRILFFLFLFYFATRATVGDWARIYETSPQVWRPVSFFRWLPKPPASARFRRLVDVTAVVWKISILWAASGVFFPLGGIAATITTLLMLGYENQFGKIHHLQGMLPIIALILSCAPADALCHRPVFELTSSSHGFFWPIQLARVQLVIIWFCAGIAKVRHSGLRWGVSNNLSSLLKLHVMDYYFIPPKLPRLARWLSRQDLLCRGLAVGTLVFELAAPAALFYEPFGQLFALLGMGLLVGFAAAQGPTFLPLFLMLFLFWAPV
jgi:hypothetical protein